MITPEELEEYLAGLDLGQDWADLEDDPDENLVADETVFELTVYTDTYPHYGDKLCTHSK